MTSRSNIKRQEALTSFASFLSSAITDDGARPLEASSVSLACFVSSAVPFDETCAAFPSLCLRNRDLPGAANATAAMSLEESAAFHLAMPLLCSKSDLPNIPVKIVENLSGSFAELINARLRSSLKAFVRQMLATTERAGIKYDIHTQLLIRLLGGSPVTPTMIVSSFRVMNIEDCHAFTDKIILPLVFEAVVDLSMFDTPVTVTLRSPGTITGSFDSAHEVGDEMLKKIEVAFDTIAFLQCMMKQACFAVRKAVVLASGIAKLTAKGALRGSSCPEISKTIPIRFPQQLSCQKLHRKSDELSEIKKLSAPLSSSSTSLDIKSKNMGCHSEMPPPPPRGPLRSSRSVPGLHFGAYSRKLSSGSLYSSTATLHGLNRQRMLRKGMPIRSPMSERGSDPKLFDMDGIAQNHGTTSNIEWGTVDASNVAVQGLTLLRKVALGIKAPRDAEDRHTQVTGSSQKQDGQSFCKKRGLPRRHEGATSSKTKNYVMPKVIQSSVVVESTARS